MKTAQLCPVCNGKGIVPGGFYTFVETEPPAPISGLPETCRSCEGKGYLTIEQDSDELITCTINTCANCSNREPVLYTSNPPKYKCTLDNSYHYTTYVCPNHTAIDSVKQT